MFREKNFYLKYNSWRFISFLLFFAPFKILMDFVIAKEKLSSNTHDMAEVIIGALLWSFVMTTALKFATVVNGNRWEERTDNKEMFAFHPIVKGFFQREGHLIIEDCVLYFETKKNVKVIDVKTIEIMPRKVDPFTKIVSIYKHDALWINGDRELQFIVEDPNLVKERIEREVIKKEFL